MMLLRPQQAMLCLVLVLALLARPAPVHAALSTPGFTLHPASIDCPSECAKRGMVTVAAGDTFAQKHLCIYQITGYPPRYGTWRGGNCSFYDFGAGSSLKTITYPSQYQCPCKPKAAVLTWSTPAACPAPAVHSQGAAYDLQVCRLRRLDGKDYQLGTYWNSTCYIPAAKFGSNGGLVTVVEQGTPNAGALKLQLLCKPSAAAPGLTSDEDVLPTCPYTCDLQQKEAVPAGTGSSASSKYLCRAKPYADGLIVDGVSWIRDLFGTASIDVVGTPKGCYYQNQDKSLNSRHVYDCACRSPVSAPLTWSASRWCVGAVGSAAASMPSVCRVRKAGGGDWQLGYVTRGMCHVGTVSFGAQDKQVANVTGFGASYGVFKVQALCKPGDRRKCASKRIPPSRQGLVRMAEDLAAAGKLMIDTRVQPQFGAAAWAAIKSTCPPKAPAFSNPAALVTWLYYAVAGGETDYLNGQAWSGGSIVAMAQRGVLVSKTKYVFSTTLPLTRASTTLADPGDLVFYGRPPSAHVALYLGRGRVLSFSGVGKPGGKAAPAIFLINGVPGMPPVDQIRAYPDFLL